MKKARYERTIRRDLVHRTSVAEVFVTGVRASDDDAHIADVQLPRAHAYFSDHVGPWDEEYDLIMAQEAFRQGGMAVLHRFHGLPTSTAFLLRGFDVERAGSASWRIDPTPAHLVCRVRIVRPFYTKDRLSGGLVALELERDGVLMARASYSFSCTTPAGWSVLRSTVRQQLDLDDTPHAAPGPARATTATVGRNHPANVVIGEPRVVGDGASADLVVDQRHATFFDHPLDHVPGALLIEATRQLSVALLQSRATDAAPVLRRIACRFTNFVEFDLPSTVTAAARWEHDEAVLECEVTQAGRVAASVTLHFRWV
jgi:hypothetical protein